jgi:hypothetical protein
MMAKIASERDKASTGRRVHCIMVASNQHPKEGFTCFSCSWSGRIDRHIDDVAGHGSSTVERANADMIRAIVSSPAVTKFTVFGLLLHPARLYLRLPTPS